MTATKQHAQKLRLVPVAPFRQFLPEKDHPRYQALLTSTAEQWYATHKDLPPVKSFLAGLEFRNLDRPYKGFTADGNVINPFIYAREEGAPTKAAVSAAEALLSLLSIEQKAATCFDEVEVDEIRMWSNPEFYINPGGLRLDECAENVRDAVHAVLRASLSADGYAKVLGCCLVNGFLGGLLNGDRVMNEHSYNFRLFGVPDCDQPWALTFFGHHLCIAVFFQGNRMVIGPSFMGAEPDYIDEGPHAGLRLFEKEEALSLRLMQSLSTDLQKQAVLFTTVRKECLGDHWVPHDERHLGGAGQDNRVVPYEGCPVSSFNQQQQDLVVSLFDTFNEYYPQAVLEHRRELFKCYLHQTYFAWIGGIGEEELYYFRIHSPVAFMEFDVHAGVFLTNNTPEKYHIHTINRIPNRGDYGKALLDQHKRDRKSVV